MKYDILYQYRDYLNNLVKNNRISKLTANSYYSILNCALKDINFSIPEDLNKKEIQEHLYKFSKDSKRQNKVSKLSNSLRLFSECFDNEYNYSKDKYFFKETISNKSRHRLTKSKKIEVAKDNKKIATIKDKSMYFAFKTMQLSGVRIGTASKLKKKDFMVSENGIKLNLRKEIMKRNQEGIVTLLRDDKFYKDLKDFLNLYKDDDNIFPTIEKIQHTANSLKLESHNLRRIFAKINYRKALRDGMTRKDAKQYVKQQLCHIGSSYKKYLSAKANFKNVDLNKFYRKNKHREDYKNGQ